jgi:hypothetical protein
LGFALRVIVYDAVYHLSVAIISYRHFPAREVAAIEKRDEASGAYFALLLTCDAANRPRLIRHKSLQFRVFLFMMDSLFTL